MWLHRFRLQVLLHLQAKKIITPPAQFTEFITTSCKAASASTRHAGSCFGNSRREHPPIPPSQFPFRLGGPGPWKAVLPPMASSR